MKALTVEIGLWDQGVTPSGGRIIDVCLYCDPIRLRLEAVVIEDEDRLAVDVIARNDSDIPTAVAHRLVRRVHAKYGCYLLEYGNSGIRTFVDLGDLLHKTSSQIN